MVTHHGDSYRATSIKGGVSCDSGNRCVGGRAWGGDFISVGAIEVTQVMADRELKKFEDFEAAPNIARAYVVLPNTLEPVDIMATMLLLTPAE